MFTASNADYFNNDLDRCVNKAYAKFVDRMKDSAQNANNALEAGQSIRQIAQHVATIAKSVEAVKHGDIAGAARALGVSISGSKADKIKKRAKQASDRWLELHFGWEPLVQDIGTNIDILQGTGKSSPKISKVVTRSSANFRGSHSVPFPTSPGGGYVDYGQDSYECWMGVRMYGQASVENPNVAIANQMGFVNPLSVAWEAVPFSFVVDWFSNVGQCISAMSDMWGFSLTHARTSTFSAISQSRLWTRSSNTGRLVKNEFHMVTRTKVGRATGILAPTIHVTPFKGFGLARGATAISLLVQQLGKINS
jgi:HPt (histidine-containing phosphotransfer) domain-containing protein